MDRAKQLRLWKKTDLEILSTGGGNCGEIQGGYSHGRMHQMPGSSTVKTGERRGGNENGQIPMHAHTG